MTQHVPPPTMTRHQFTLDDVHEMIAQGLVDKRVQLLDGGIYDMPADGRLHQLYAMRLNRLFTSTLADTPKFVGVQTTLRLASHNGPSPDLFVLSDDPPEGDVVTEQILLVIEVADTSLKDDLTDSASRYARFGVRDYWVVDVNAPCIYVHRNPANGEYPPPQRIDADATMTPLLIPDVPVRLSDIV